MELEVFWTRFAEDKLHEIFKYFLDKAGYRVAKKLSEGIFNEPFKLIKHPEIGQVEPYLVDLEIEFRYLLYKNSYKIIYWVNLDSNRIEINDIFDVRQYPLKIKRTSQE